MRSKSEVLAEIERLVEAARKAESYNNYTGLLYQIQDQAQVTRTRLERATRTELDIHLGFTTKVLPLSFGREEAFRVYAILCSHNINANDPLNNRIKKELTEGVIRINLTISELARFQHSLYLGRSVIPVDQWSPIYGSVTNALNHYSTQEPS